MKRLSKPLVVLVAVLGLVSFLATPSTASSGPLTGGTMTISTVPPFSAGFGGGGPGVDCGSTITALDNSQGDLSSRTLNGTIQFFIWVAFQVNGNWYELIGTSNGTYTSVHQGAGSGYNVAAHLNMGGGQIRTTNAANPCSSEGSVVCNVLGMNSVNLNGAANLTAAHPGPVGTFHLAGAGHVNAFGCVAPFNALNSRAVTFASLAFALV